MPKASIIVFGQRCEYMGPHGYYSYPGGWIKQNSDPGWTVCVHGMTALGKSPEHAIRRLLTRCEKVFDSIRGTQKR